MGGLRRLMVVVLVVIVAAIGQGARAQERVWVQIEAQPTLAEAQERARAYASAFPDVQGHALPSGWYGIQLGPYPRAEAEAKLAELRRERLIPADSFLADGRNFRAMFWPPEGGDPAPEALAAAEPPADAAPADPAPEPAADPTPADETPAEARAAEAALDRPAREALQQALAWFGFYDGAIDGAFGAGTRAAMTAWQEANAAEPTGVLTTAQRRALLDRHRQALAEIGLERVTEPEAGIEIDLPLAMVAFDRYAPPFVRYAEKNGSGVTALLISEPGDERTLAGLYDSLLALGIIPPGAERTRTERSFEITGRDGSVESYTRVELERGLVKGFTLVWPAADTARMTRVLDAMKASFRSTGDRALDPGLAPLDDDVKAGMVSGLELRRPALSRSGFFVDTTGTVLTTTDVTQSCERLTIEGTRAMTLRHADAATGLALLTPATPLAPPGVARFQTVPERIGAEVAVAGFPYEDALSAPTLTFGTVEALTGLNGEAGLKRLALPAQPADAGGPVVDGTGAVVGMLIPRGTDPARDLPPGVGFAASAATIADLLTTQGITPAAAPAEGALPPEDLARRARAMTVLVSCWN